MLILERRDFILSSGNPYFYQGNAAAGIGSPHTPHGNIWPMSIIMKALTSNDHQEVVEAFETLSKVYYYRHMIANISITD